MRHNASIRFPTEKSSTIRPCHAKIISIDRSIIAQLRSIHTNLLCFSNLFTCRLKEFILCFRFLCYSLCTPPVSLRLQHFACDTSLGFSRQLLVAHRKRPISANRPDSASSRLVRGGARSVQYIDQRSPNRPVVRKLFSFCHTTLSLKSLPRPHSLHSTWSSHCSTLSTPRVTPRQLLFKRKQFLLRLTGAMSWALHKQELAKQLHLHCQF